MRQPLEQEICVFKRHAAFAKSLARRGNDFVRAREHLLEPRAPVCSRDNRDAVPHKSLFVVRQNDVRLGAVLDERFKEEYVRAASRGSVTKAGADFLEPAPNCIANGGFKLGRKARRLSTWKIYQMSREDNHLGNLETLLNVFRVAVKIIEYEPRVAPRGTQIGKLATADLSSLSIPVFSL